VEAIEKYEVRQWFGQKKLWYFGTHFNLTKATRENPCSTQAGSMSPQTISGFRNRLALAPAFRRGLL
jgi:hypothetical protein